MEKSVSLVGKGDGWERAYKDAEQGREIWCVSTVFERLQAVDVQPSRIFQLHKRELFEPWLHSHGSRVILMKPDDTIPEASILPVNRLMKHFGPIFSSTFAWMFALAISEGYKEIGCVGIHLSHHTEYQGQRDSFFYFVGVAEALGIKVNIPPDSDVFIRNHAYGLEE